MRLIVQVEDCATAHAYDSGKTVYVVLDRACPSTTDARPVSLGMQAGDSTDGATVQLQLRESEEQDAVPIPGLGVRHVGLHRSGEWRKFDNTDTWQHRDGAGLLLLNGDLYLLGGWTWDTTSSEVWKTSDLTHWTFLGNAPWPARHGAAWLVHRDRLYVVGGDFMTDTWSSADGVNWVRHSASAPFGTLYTPNAVSIEGRIILYAGQGGTEGVNDVWSSEDGVAWTRLVKGAPWAGRGLIHGHAVHEGRFYLIGGGVKAVPPGQIYGETKQEFSDIWSSADGVGWRLEADTLGFPPRTHFSVVGTPRGCYVSDGSVGIQANVTNDLFFAGDCVHFAPVPDTPRLQPRHASSLAYFAGSLVILGGPPAGNAGTTVWQYFP